MYFEEWMKMNIKSFLKFVEIQTKVASVIPFTLGTLYALYRYNSFYLLNFIIMFVSLITFDMATTAINNYVDYKKSITKKGYGYEIHNAMVNDNISEKTALTIIFTLLGIASLFGIILTFKTSIAVLFVGMICFAIGIFYTFGPIPISRMPLGEAFSGFFMGFIIMFLAIFIHVYDKNILFIIFSKGMLSINVNLVEIGVIFLLSISAIGGIANIMLANNICDLEDDIQNNRFTLPYYIGKNNALKLFAFLYYIGFAASIALVVFKILPATYLFVLAAFIPVQKHIGIFTKNPSKAKTFILAVKNFVIMHMAQILVISIILIIG
jgi:1,4-dihydroxy-2-naphthoate octaprenyltransferase